MTRPGGVLAVDYGAKKTGFAVADAMRIAVHALETVRIDGDSDALLDHVAALLGEREVGTLLVGLPLNMDGTVGAGAQTVIAFAERLRARFSQEVLTYDERLTTKEAEAQLRSAGYHGRDIRERKDSWAALVLLRDWIESGEPSS